MARLATMPLDQLPLIALDLETTGLNTRQDRVLQIGLVEMRAPFEEQSILVKPDIAIPSKSTAIHGIDDADVAQADPFPLAFHIAKTSWLTMWLWAIILVLTLPFLAQRQNVMVLNGGFKQGYVYAN